MHLPFIKLGPQGSVGNPGIIGPPGKTGYPGKKIDLRNDLYFV
jgi:hypothetical protein